MGSVSLIRTGDYTASPEPVEPSELHPNEPSGNVPISERGFSALDEGSWNDSDASSGSTPKQTLSIHTDATAPHSPSSVMRITFPEGLTAGGSSSRAIHSRLGLSGAMDVYWSFWVKLSPNFQGHPAGDNKIVYLYEAGGEGSAHPYLTFYGGGANPLRVGFVNQQAGFSGYRWDWEDGGASGSVPNEVSVTAGDAEITRDVWHLVECRVVCNDEGVANGGFHAWLNGKKIIQYSSVEHCWGNGWQTFDLHTIWGGNVAGESDAEMYMDFDHLYISRGP